MKIQLLKFKSVNSTNDIAIRRIKNGKTKPALIITDIQKKGRGQYGRKWISYKGNIFLSIYFTVKKNISQKSMTKKIYQTLKKSLNSFVNEKITIKSPNDLLIKGNKVCGILQETIIYKNDKFFIVGVGVNLCNSPNIGSKKISHLQKYSSNKLKKSEIYKNIKKNFEKFIII